MIPQKTLCIRSGVLSRIPTTDLVVGDVINVKVGDRVPADAVIFSSTELRVDNSTLTGESEPVERNMILLGCAHDVGALEAKNMIFSGSVIVNGMLSVYSP